MTEPERFPTIFPFLLWLDISFGRVAGFWTTAFDSLRRHEWNRATEFQSIDVDS